LIQVRAHAPIGRFNTRMTTSRRPLDASPNSIEALALDLRDLPPPEPMLRILEALPTLQPGQTLIARTPCRPVPLIERLEAEGYRVAVATEPSGEAWVQIFAGDGRAGA
jgi:uncharacterized protein (DUF2249 family)